MYQPESSVCTGSINGSQGSSQDGRVESWLLEYAVTTKKDLLKTGQMYHCFLNQGTSWLYSQHETTNAVKCYPNERARAEILCRISPLILHLWFWPTLGKLRQRRGHSLTQGLKLTQQFSFFNLLI